jgi:hypothetical protein
MRTYSRLTVTSEALTWAMSLSIKSSTVVVDAVEVEVAVAVTGAVVEDLRHLYLYLGLC